MILSRGARLPFPMGSIHDSSNADPTFSWSTRSVVVLLLYSEIVPAMALCLPLGLVTGLACKRLAIQVENGSALFRSIRNGWLQSLVSSLCTCLTADLLVEICLWGSGWNIGGYSFFWSRSLMPASSLSIPGSIVRLLLLWIGIRLGEQFTPVALTGSIATGKSTVSQILSASSSSLSSSLYRPPRFLIHMVDTDAIGHEILLPPRELERRRRAAAAGTTTVSSSCSSSSSATTASITTTTTTCTPRDSVYARILDEFGDAKVDNQNILHKDGNGVLLIDRRKLGDIIFKDGRRRRALNRITHPKIIWVLLKQLVYHLYGNSSSNSRAGKSVVTVADVPLLYESGKLPWLFALKVVVACDPDVQLARLRQRNTDLTDAQCRERIASQIPVLQKIARADVVIYNNSSLEELKREIHDAQRRIVALLRGKSLLPLSTFVAMIGSLWIVGSACFSGQ